jgi:hypothetical protein
MKPGNRHENEMVPIHTKQNFALGDERKDNNYLCLSAHMSERHFSFSKRKH